MRTYKELIRDAVRLANDTEIPERDFKKHASVLQFEASRYGVATEIEAILRQRKQPVKTAASHFNYNNIPLRNRAETTKAASWFRENRERFDFNTRRSHALRILDAADKFGVQLDSATDKALKKSAGIGLVNRQIILHELTKRAEYLKNTQRGNLSSVLTKVAKEVESTPDDAELQTSKTLVKLAEFVDAFDRRYGIVFKYGKGFTIPEDFIFIESEEPIYKTAALVGNEKTGKYYAPEDLERLDLTKFAELMGQDFVKQASVAGIGIDVLGIREWLKSAGLKEARLFDILANEQNIYHVAEKVPVA